MRKKFTLLISCAVLFAMFSLQAMGQTLLDENFNSYKGDAPEPAGWNELNGMSAQADSNSIWDANFSTYYSDTVSAVAGFSSWNSNSLDSWLVTPTLDLTQNGGENRLSFFYKGKNELLGANDSVSVMISVDGGATFELVKTFHDNLPTKWSNEIIDLAGWGTSNNVKLAFYFHDDTEESEYNKFYLDDVTISAKPAHDFAVLSDQLDERTIQDTTVFAGESINFHAVVKNYGTTTESTPVKWICESGSPATNSETSPSLAFEQKTHYTFTNTWTAPSTSGNYSLKIFTDHADDAARDNDTAIVNVTVYQPYQSFTENFDAAEAWPFGWHALPHGTYNLEVIEDSYYSNSNPNCIKFGTNAELNYMAITPAVEIQSGQSYRLTTNISGSSNAEIAIGTISEFMDTTTFIPHDTAVVQESYTYQAHELILDNPGIKQIVFKYNKTGKSVYIDDVSFEEVAPYSVKAQRITPEGSVVEGGSLNYKVQLRNKGINDETFDLSASGGWSYSVLDQQTQDEITQISLNAEQTDTVIVQAQAPSSVVDSVSDQMTFIAASQQDNNVTDTVWANSYAYETFTALDESFEDAEAMPFAWSALDSEGGNVNIYSSSYSAHTGANYVSLSNAETGTIVGMMTPALAQYSLYRLNFYQNGNGTLIVGKTTNPDDLSTIDTLGEYAGGYSYSEVELTFSAENAATYIVFLHKVNGGYDKVEIDDVTLEQVSSYAVEITGNAPGTSVATGLTTQYWVGISNTGSEVETYDLSASGNWNYTIENQEQSATIDTIQLEPGTVDSVLVEVEVPESGIADGDIDEVTFVAASQNNSSATDTAFITTEAYNPVNALEEGFEATSELPGYWTGMKFAQYSSAGINTYGGYNSEQSAKVYESSSATGHSYVLTPVISNDIQQYRLSFYSKCYSSGDHLMIGKMTDPSDTATFEVIDTISVTSSYSKDSLVIEIQGKASIAFATVTSGNTVYVDEVQLAKLPDVTIYPADGSNHIAIDSTITMKFNTKIRNQDDSEISSEYVDTLITLKTGGPDGTEVPFDATINTEKTEISVVPDNNWTSETDYYAAFADSIVEDTNNALVPGEEVSFTTEDALAPQFVDGYPVGIDTTHATYEFAVSLNETGHLAYVVVPDNATAPTTEQVLEGADYENVEVVASNTMIVDAANQEFTETISDLMLNTSYDLYMVARDDAMEPNVQSDVTMLEVTTLADQTAPDFSSGYPEISQVDKTTATLMVQLNEKGVAYFMVVPDNATEPTSSEVKQGADYGSVSVMTSGNMEIAEANTEFTGDISGLEAGTDYDVYVVAQDSADSPNLQDSPVMKEFTTNEDATAITDAFEQETSVYPNPVVDWLHVESKQMIQTIQIYDVLGNVQMDLRSIHTRQTRINLQKLESGIYLIKITDNNKNTVIRKIRKN